MKVVRKPSVIPYGPVGHPNARLFPEFERNSGAAAGEALRLHASRMVSSCEPLLLFYNRKVSAGQNGFHMLNVENDAVSDADIAALPDTLAYTPAKPGQPGRQLLSFVTAIPAPYAHSESVLGVPLASATVDCDHDFGLESGEVVFREAATGRLVHEPEFAKMSYREMGGYFLSFTCTRCGRIHGLPRIASSGALARSVNTPQA